MKQAEARKPDHSQGTVQFGWARRTSRLLMIIVLIAAFVLLALAVSYYTSHTTQVLEEQLIKKMEVSVEQTCSNLDYRLEQVEESTRTMISIFYQYLNSDAGFNEQMKEYKTICSAMEEQLERHMVVSLRLYVPDEKIYADQHTKRYALRRLSELDSENRLYVKGGVFWETPHQVQIGMEEPREALSCGVALKSQKSYEQLCGVLFADIDLSQFQEIFASGSIDEDEMFLIDSEGYILIHQDVREIGKAAVNSDVMAALREKGSGYLVNGDEILAFGRLDVSDWYVLSSMPRFQRYATNQGTVNTIMIMWLVICLILFILAVTLAYNLSLSHTVSRINTAIKSLETEGRAFGQESPGQSDTENAEEGLRPNRRIPSRKYFRDGYKVTSLEQDTEQIVRSIADVVEARYQDRLAISEYQMEALQEQIKPHFLYNTLDVIKWMIMDQKQEESVWMVNMLSKYLRMSISKGNPVVPLSEEIELTRMYLGIMQKRFTNQFQVKYELEEETFSFQIPRLSLQPLVENALVHGIFRCDKKEKCLTLRSWRANDSFAVEIEDNGSGMPKEQARRLTEMEVHAGESYGIANVRRRLKIFGQGKCSFLVVSREGIGTCVTIELPVRDRSGAM